MSKDFRKYHRKFKKDCVYKQIKDVKCPLNLLRLFLYPYRDTTCADSVLFVADPYKESSSPLTISCKASEGDLRNLFDGASASISPTYKIAGEYFINHFTDREHRSNTIR